MPRCGVSAGGARGKRRAGWGDMIGGVTLVVVLGGLAVGEALGGSRLSPRSGQHRVFSKMEGPATRGSHFLRLRGGGGGGGGGVDSTLATNGPSGVWDGFKRIGGAGLGEGVGDLSCTLADVWGQAGSARRTQPDLRLAVRCEGLPHDAVVTATGCCMPERQPGSWEDPPSQEWTIPLVREDPQLPYWTGGCRLPPGSFCFNYNIVNIVGAGETEAGGAELASTRTLVVRQEPSKQAVMLATDLDGTLLGDDDGIRDFFTLWNAEYKSKGSALVYNTGRPFDSAMRLISSGKIEQPDALVCSEGTEIFWFDAAGNPVKDLEWRDKLNSRWKWGALKAAVEGAILPFEANIEKKFFLADDGGQPMIVLGLTSQNATAAMVAAMEADVRTKLGLQYDIIQSQSGSSWYVLLVPSGAGKGSAALHCAVRLGFPPERLMVSGDGENDLPLFEATAVGAKGLLVANACEGLRKAFGAGSGPGSANVIAAARNHAYGIIDGLCHHFAQMGYDHTEVLGETGEAGEVIGTASAVVEVAEEVGEVAQEEVAEVAQVVAEMAQEVGEVSSGDRLATHRVVAGKAQLVAKVCLGDDMRRITVSPFTYEHLFQEVCSRFGITQPLSRGVMVRLRYKDDDGDLVTLASEADVKAAKFSGPIRIEIRLSDNRLREAPLALWSAASGACAGIVGGCGTVGKQAAAALCCYANSAVTGCIGLAVAVGGAVSLVGDAAATAVLRFADSLRAACHQISAGVLHFTNRPGEPPTPPNTEHAVDAPKTEHATDAASGVPTVFGVATPSGDGAEVGPASGDSEVGPASGDAGEASPEIVAHLEAPEDCPNC